MSSSSIHNPYFERFQLLQIKEALRDTPVITINGPRQSGKSTLASELIRPEGTLHAVTLDDRIQFAAAQQDPQTYVEQHSGLFVIDEVQRVPELLLAIKATVDRDRRPGRFILTGSTRLLMTPKISESLAGRMEIVDLWPLSQGELSGKRETFLDALFAWDLPFPIVSEWARSDYAESICKGGFPEAVTRAENRRNSWFDHYATTVLQRMFAEIASIDRLQEMPKLFKACAARTATELNIAALANDLQIPARTLDAYLSHLQTIFMIDLIPAWSRNLTSKIIHRPKIILTDSGLAARLQRVNANSFHDPVSSMGQLLETFVIMELKKQITWSHEHPTLYHFRSREGVEVDVILESDNGTVVGIEIKAAAMVSEKDFKGLRFLQKKLGEKFIGGIVLHTGRQSAPFGKNLAAVPVSALWE